MKERLEVFKHSLEQVESDQLTAGSEMGDWREEWHLAVSAQEQDIEGHGGELAFYAGHSDASLVKAFLQCLSVILLTKSLRVLLSSTNEQGLMSRLWVDARARPARWFGPSFSSTLVGKRLKSFSQIPLPRSPDLPDRSSVSCVTLVEGYK